MTPETTKKQPKGVQWPLHHPFRQRDVTRAVRSARAAGLAVGGVEVVTKDGTTIRILSKDTAEHGGNDLDNWIAKRGKKEG